MQLQGHWEGDTSSEHYPKPGGLEAYYVRHAWPQAVTVLLDVVHQALDKAGVGPHSSLDVGHQLHTVLADVLISLQEQEQAPGRMPHLTGSHSTRETGSAAPGSQAFNLLPFARVKVLNGQAVGQARRESLCSVQHCDASAVCALTPPAFS